MALDHDDLFEDLGALVKCYNLFLADAQNISTRIDAIQDAFADEHQEAAIEQLRDTQENAWLAEYEGRRAALAGYAAQRLTDRESVLDEIDATSNTISEALSKLIEYLSDNSETVNASSTVVGSITPGGDNVGDGTVIVTELLDRVTSPGSRAGTNFAAHYLYGDLETELTVTETMILRCVSDSYADGQSEGGETFRWDGDLADSQHGVLAAEGSGYCGNVNGIHGSTALYLTNADFEIFTVTNTPDNWTIDAGAVTTNIAMATGSDKFHGTNGLKFLGDGAAAAIQVSQSVAAAVKPGKRYCCTLRLKASATIAAGAFTAQLEGTGYTAGTLEKISIAAGSLPTAWTLYSFNVLIPANAPDDLKLVLKWTGTPTNAKNLWIDDVGFGEVAYGGGVGVVVVRGATPFVRDDRVSFTLTATEGVLQKFFRRAFGVQLPSDGAGGETLLDSLAT